jgi:hypothetical protein
VLVRPAAERGASEAVVRLEVAGERVDRNEWMGSLLFLINEGAWVVRLASRPNNKASGLTDAWFIASSFYFPSTPIGGLGAQLPPLLTLPSLATMRDFANMRSSKQISTILIREK